MTHRFTPWKGDAKAMPKGTQQTTFASHRLLGQYSVDWDEQEIGDTNFMCSRFVAN
jgi:hypothetical protein